MREYETIYVLKPDLPSEQLTKLNEKVSGIIQKAEGHVLFHTDWGKLKLAYDVKKFRFAHYFYFQYLDNGDSISELERILKYDDNVLKFLTVKLRDGVSVEERLAQPKEPPLSPVEIQSSRGGESVKSRRDAEGSRTEKTKERPESPPAEKHELGKGLDDPEESSNSKEN